LKTTCKHLIKNNELQSHCVFEFLTGKMTVAHYRSIDIAKVHMKVLVEV